LDANLKNSTHYLDEYSTTAKRYKVLRPPDSLVGVAMKGNRGQWLALAQAFLQYNKSLSV
jgi:hypothetical protein